MCTDPVHPLAEFVEFCYATVSMFTTCLIVRLLMFLAQLDVPNIIALMSQCFQISGLKDNKLV